MEKIQLANGVAMPLLGYGVFLVPSDECERCVSDALKGLCPKKCVTIISYIFHFVQNYLLSFQHLH